MSEPNDGGPAFPQTIDDMGTMRSVTCGMALRDYFAAKAMQATLSREDTVSNGESGYAAMLIEIGRMSYQAADAMLKARDGQ